MKINTIRLEKERKRRKLTREKFSVLFSLHPTTYGKIIKTQSTTFKRLSQIADSLRINPKLLIE